MMTPAQRIESAHRRHDEAMTALCEKAQEYGENRTWWRLRDLLTAARAYGAACRHLARLKP